jgi:Raf kinase inhibitor-like YbhB/YbcL family protein
MNSQRICGLLFVAAMLCAAILPGNAQTLAGSAGSAREGGAMSFKLTSSAFENGATIPKQFTCDGTDLSPALEWSGAPEKTKSFSLIVDDPDAPVGTWVHWVLYDLPADAKQLGEGVAKEEQLANGAQQGRNDFRRIGYGGPCPPAGPAHRYFFKLYALDAMLNLKAGASKADVEKAMAGHVLAQAALMGRYKR